MQNEIIIPSRLLDQSGELIQRGYATSPILDYRRKDVARKLRLKEWDYYLIYNEDYAVAMTIGTSVRIGLFSASFIDLKRNEETTKTVVVADTLGQLNLPESSVKGDITYNEPRVKVSFKNDEGKRKLRMVMRNFSKGSDLDVAIILQNEPRDSMVIATPFQKDRKAFYYNRKIIGMNASGKVLFQGKPYSFAPDTSLGLLDWGRGVWPYRTTWYWSAAHDIVDGDVFGFNLGYGFGDTSAATENMLFFKGTAHKLKDVLFLISQKDNGEYDYLKPWIITSSDHRLEMKFEPILDRSVTLSAIVLATEQHQVFGRFSGKAVLDDFSVVLVKDMVGFAERVDNRW